MLDRQKRLREFSLPSFLFERIMSMYEEQRLISIGFPISDALSVCHSLRKDGTLQSFVEEKEKEFRENYSPKKGTTDVCSV